MVDVAAKEKPWYLNSQSSDKKDQSGGRAQKDWGGVIRSTQNTSKMKKTCFVVVGCFLKKKTTQGF